MARLALQALAVTALCLLSGCRGQTLSDAIQAARGSGATPSVPVSGATPAAPITLGGSPADDVSSAAGPSDESLAAAGPLAAGPLAAQTPLGAGIAPNKDYTAPVAKYLSDTNSSQFSITWLAIEAANFADAVNDPDLAVTIFVPTNAAWEKRLPTITRQLGIQAHDLFSIGKSDALRGIMQYHILATVIKSARDIKGTLSTNSNLCSNAKAIKATQGQGSIQLESAGGVRAFVLDKGMKLGNPATKKYSTLFPIDDVLLPDVVTIPLNIALQAYNSTAAELVAAVADESAAIANLDQSAATGDLAPVYPQPATPITTTGQAAPSSAGR